MRRTNEDKRRAVLRMLEDAEWGKWSNVEIAKRCNVSDEFVRQVRLSLPFVGSDAPRAYINKHGTQSTMNTAYIGKKPPALRGSGPDLVPAVPTMPSGHVARGNLIRDLSGSDVVERGEDPSDFDPLTEDEEDSEKRFSRRGGSKSRKERLRLKEILLMASEATEIKTYLNSTATPQ